MDKISQLLTSSQDEIRQELNKQTQEETDQGSDKIRKAIDVLFKGRVGKKPENQDVLDKIFREGEKRFSIEMPPGYKDSDKAKTQDFCFGGLVYQRKFGDLILWIQIIEYAKSNKIRNVIFITDDQKEDWWLKHKGKKYGARPELIDEIKRETQVKNFHIYAVDNFLSHAKAQIGASVEVSEKSIQEVKAYSRYRNDNMHRFKRNMHGEIIYRGGGRLSMEMVKEADISQSVRRWLEERHDDVSNGSGLFDFVAIDDGRLIGYEIKVFSKYLDLKKKLHSLMMCLRHEDFDYVSLVIVCRDKYIAEDVSRLIKEQLSENLFKDKMIQGVQVVVGISTRLDSVDAEPLFIPISINSRLVF